MHVTSTRLLPNISMFILLVALCLIAQGCTSIGSSHPSRVNPLINTLRSNGSVDLEDVFSSSLNGKNRVLYLMERGRVAQLQGDTVSSIDSYSRAIETISEEDDKAMLRASDAFAQASAIMINDRAIPYNAEGYERVMVHSMQALNYLSQGDVGSAGVEIRRSNAEQEEGLLRHEREIEIAESKAREKNINLPMEKLDAIYAGMDQRISGLKNSFQNAYSFYVSGLVYELLGEPNDAYIDYKKALELAASNTYLQKDVMRLAESLSMKSDLAGFRKIYKNVEVVSPLLVGQGELVLLFEDDFVAQKQEVWFDIPLIWDHKKKRYYRRSNHHYSAPYRHRGYSYHDYDLSYTAVAYPVYNLGSESSGSLLLYNKGSLLGRSEKICSIDYLAAKALKEHVASITVRQILRTTAKAVAAKAAHDSDEDVGLLFLTIYNLVSERADLRSWVSLPGNCQVMRIKMPVGSHQLSVNSTGTTSAQDVMVDIEEGAITLLIVRRTGSCYRVWSEVFPVSGG